MGGGGAAIWGLRECEGVKWRYLLLVGLFGWERSDWKRLGLGVVSEMSSRLLSTRESIFERGVRVGEKVSRTVQGTDILAIPTPVQ